MPIAYLSPLPPSRTGIAHYSAMLLPALRERLDVTPIGSPEGYDADAFDLAIYHLGNNPHHEWIYREAMRRPGLVVLHDMVLHHLIVEMTLARGDADAYVEALAASHGAAGAAWARGRAIGLHDEIGNFLFPASVDIANRSRGVLVHNEWAAERLRSLGVLSPIFVVGHPADPAPVPGAARRDATRERLGIRAGARVIGLFGFLTSAKRAEVVLRAFEQGHSEGSEGSGGAISAGRRGPSGGIPHARNDLVLLIVGEAAPNIDLARFEDAQIITTGYVADEEFSDYYAAVDLLVNLRYPSAGETSGTLIRAFAAGKPVAVSDYAQFAELPDDAVVKIPLGATEVDSLTSFFVREFDVALVAAAQRRWIEEHASMQSTVAGYLDAIAGIGTGRGGPSHFISRAVPLFPRLSVVARSGAEATVRNEGELTLRARVYGAPGYRLLGKLFDGAREIEDRWIELPGDLAPGEEVTIGIPFRSGATLRLYHAMEGIAIVEPEPWYASPL